MFVCFVKVFYDNKRNETTIDQGEVWIQMGQVEIPWTRPGQRTELQRELERTRRARLVDKVRWSS